MGSALPLYIAAALSLSHFLSHIQTLSPSLDCNLIQFSDAASREKAFKKRKHKHSNRNNIETYSKQ